MQMGIPLHTNVSLQTFNEILTIIILINHYLVHDDSLHVYFALVLSHYHFLHFLYFYFFVRFKTMLALHWILAIIIIIYLFTPGYFMTTPLLYRILAIVILNFILFIVVLHGILVIKIFHFLFFFVVILRLHYFAWRLSPHYFCIDMLRCNILSYFIARYA